MGVEKIFGADFSQNMLKLFNEKSDWVKGRIIQMVAENIPLKDESVTNITVAFGVRNFYNIQQAFNSFNRVLKQNGKATIIEFRIPSNKIFKDSVQILLQKNTPRSRRFYFGRQRSIQLSSFICRGV